MKLPANDPARAVPPQPSDAGQPRHLLIATGAALLLTFVFWGTLWEGGGLIGGDLYTYYFPQKKFYATRLHAGEIPLWNSLAGNGYPLVAESQTGVFYPFHLLSYPWLDANTAYNSVQIVHYVLAFLFTWLYARRIDLSPAGAGLAALVYTYGWFPVRMCLEWAIVGGAWLPLALWSVESFLQTARWRYLFCLTAALAMQLLPGHYNLGFLTQLTLVAYIPLRLWFARDLPAEISGARKLSLAALGLAGLLGFALSAVQLLPTWELRQISQRATEGKDFAPGYGNIPLSYLPQVLAPWWYYGPEPQLHPSPGMAATNKVEAHLYFGMLPLLLCGLSLAKRLWRHDGRLLIWLLIGVLALVYTPGWLLPVTKHLPGFGFFSGPGRYGMITTLAVALLAGAGLERFLAGCRGWSRGLVAAVVFLVTTADLWYVNETISFNQTIQVAEPPLRRLDKSPVRHILQEAPYPVRLFSRGANLPTILGFASTPAYLGIGPSAYFDQATRMPEPLPFDEPATPQQVDWLRRAGVTHVLSFIPLDPGAWPVQLAWAGYDPFLNPAWARREPLYLYQLDGSRGRLSWQIPHSGGTATIVEYRANRVSAEAASEQGGRLVLTDLDFPGWELTVDDRPVEGVVVDGMYRGVDLPPGTHRVVWTYRPRSVAAGGLISLLTLLLLAGVGHVRYWHPDRIQRLYNKFGRGTTPHR